MSNITLVFIIELVIFTALLIPTVIALISGAPWVPTPKARAERMLELANLKPDDIVYDLGCGDGRLVQIASKKIGARAVGFELSPLIYFMARVRNFLLRSKAQIVFRDFRHVDLGKATILVCYLLPETLARLREKFSRELLPGTRIISYAFEIKEWTPASIEPKDPKRNFAKIFIYEMPAPSNQSISTYAQGNPAKK